MLTKLKQFKDFLNTNKYIIPSLTCVFFVILYILQFVSGLCFDIIFGFLVLSFALLCSFASFGQILAVLLFFISLNGIHIKVFDIGWYNFITFIFVSVFGIRYCVELTKGSKQIKLFPIIMTIILIFYGLNGLVVENILYWVNDSILLLVAYLTFAYKSEIKVSTLIKYLLTGLIVSSIVGGLILCWSEEMRKISTFGSDGIRFMALAGNPNTLQVLCVIALSILITIYCLGKINLVLFVPLFSLYFVIGLTTKSKAFMICVVILALIFIIYQIKTNRKRGLKIFELFESVPWYIDLEFPTREANVPPLAPPLTLELLYTTPIWLLE